MLANFFFDPKSRMNFLSGRKFLGEHPCRERRKDRNNRSFGLRKESAGAASSSRSLRLSFHTSLSAVSPLLPTSRLSQVTDCEVRKSFRNKTRDKTNE